MAKELSSSFSSFKAEASTTPDKSPPPRHRPRTNPQLKRSSATSLGTAASSSTSQQQQFQQQQERRRSSRKSINGLIIEFDLEDEDETELYANCEDYAEEHLQSSLTRRQSNESLEELRTHLEALEHQRSTETLPEHDEWGWGEDCVYKQMLEALETHSHSCNGTTATARSSPNPSLSEIPEEDEFLENSQNADNHRKRGEEEEEDCSRDGQEEVATSSRRSTIRSSIHGLVLEYDWTTDDSDNEDGEDDAHVR